MTSRRRETRLHAFDADAAPAAPAKAAPERPEAPAPRSVSEVVASVNRLLADDPALASVWVRGEISGFKAHPSGHWYFSLKDERAVLSAAMFRGANARARFLPEEGMEVLARGRVAVYAERSQLQVVVEELRPVGQGGLSIAFEQIKRRLAAEGLFDPARKRALPGHPVTVGIVTSLQAAALRDMARVATERNPAVRLLVAHASVQGEAAPAEIAAALARLAADGRADVIVVGRGGGSAEDLWAFNDERVVRAVAASRVPVVSAVGHETDFTLCDLAADLRAATPSNAMEIVVPDAEALLDRVDDAENRAWSALERIVPDLHQRVDDLDARLEDAVRRAVAHEREVLGVQAARLGALSPLATLARGYAVATRDGRVVRSVDQAPPGAEVEIALPDGRLGATVRTARKEAPHGQDAA